MQHAIYLKVAGWNLLRAAASGQLRARVSRTLGRSGAPGRWAGTERTNGLAVGVTSGPIVDRQRPKASQHLARRQEPPPDRGAGAGRVARGLDRGESSAAEPQPAPALARRQEPPPDRGARERFAGGGGLDLDGSSACGAPQVPPAEWIVRVRSRTSPSTLPAARNRRRIAARGSGSLGRWDWTVLDRQRADPHQPQHCHAARNRRRIAARGSGSSLVERNPSSHEAHHEETDAERTVFYSPLFVFRSSPIMLAMTPATP